MARSLEARPCEQQRTLLERMGFAHDSDLDVGGYVTWRGHGLEIDLDPNFAPETKWMTKRIVEVAIRAGEEAVSQPILKALRIKR